MFGKCNYREWNSCPFAVWDLTMCIALSESLPLGMESKVRDKLPLSVASCQGLIVYKYLEGSVKRSLERELNVPERSDCEFNGWRILLRETCKYARTAQTFWKCADCFRGWMGPCAVCERICGRVGCVTGWQQQWTFCGRASRRFEPSKCSFSPSWNTDQGVYQMYEEILCIKCSLINVTSFKLLQTASYFLLSMVCVYVYMIRPERWWTMLA